VFEVPADGAGEGQAFDVAAAFDEIGELLAVGDAADLLFDDGAVVEDLGDVVGSGADEFDAAFEGGVVGFGAGEGGQEGVVDVDDAGREARDEVLGEDLHVAGEDDEIDLLLGEQAELAGLGFGLVGGVDGDENEGDAVEAGQGAGVFVVGEDEADVGGEFAGAVAVEEVGQAV